MESIPTFFDNPAPPKSTNQPDGLIYIDDFLSSEEEKSLVKFIDEQKWNTSISRRTQHYGYNYSYTGRDVTPTTPIPPIFSSIRERLRSYFNCLPDQMIINEYKPGQGIAAHTDHIGNFGPVVVSISLLAPVEMEFTRNSIATYPLILKPRSAVILTGESRYKWKHEIARRASDVIDGKIVQRLRRISLTFRTVRKK